MEATNGKIQWPGWETTRLIGRGSVGAVYEIQRGQPGAREKAALKVFSIPQNQSDIEEMRRGGYDPVNISGIFQSYLKSIVAGYSATRKLTGSANAVRCEDMRCVQHEDGIGWDIFIKMELLTPLLTALPEQVTEAHALQVGMDVCKALVLCAQQDIIHRDIKPQNIFVTPNGECKLGDFGIVQTVEKTTEGARPRDCPYMAPEVYNDQPYGVCADIYSLGLVLYWLLNEKRMPFLPSAQLRPGERKAALLRRMQGEPLPAPKNGTPELQEIVLKACAYNPSHRYGTAAELLAALEDISGRVGQKTAAELVSISGRVGQKTAAELVSISGRVGQKTAFRQEPEQEIDQPGKKPLTQTKARKNVLCVLEKDPMDAMRAWTSFWGQKNIKRSQVTEVIFRGTLQNPGANAWDVSASRDESILAWMEGSVLHVATDGVIALNPKSAYLFCNFQNLTSIDFGNCVDTSQVTNMGSMFRGCSCLQSVDVSNFDTSLVTDMGCMFEDCKSLQRLDLSNFQTTAHTKTICQMSYMFSGCKDLRSLDLSGVKDSRVLGQRMFSGCHRLTSLKCNNKTILQAYKERNR